MYEVVYYYQNIWTNLAGNIVDGSQTLEILNEYRFRDLSNYRLEWELLCNGEAVSTGTVDQFNVPAQKKAYVTLPLSEVNDNGEWLLNVKYVLKRSEPLLKAGTVMAHQQIELGSKGLSGLSGLSGLKGLTGECQLAKTTVEPKVTDAFDVFSVEGPNFAVSFDKRSGLISRYEANGVSLLADGARLKPNFWRAPTDNDYGANLQRKYAAWSNPTLKLTSFKSNSDEGAVVVQTEFEIASVAARLALTYTITGDGAVRVNEKMTVDPAQQRRVDRVRFQRISPRDAPIAEGERSTEASDLFRFGMQLPMPESMEQIKYYGRGPVETYCDRKDSEHLGIYESTVTREFYPYIRPQENGNHVDLRWWRLTDASGRGLMVVADEPFSASALHYTIESLDEGFEKRNLHSPDVDASPLTNLCIDRKQMGLGCVNSWGALPREEYFVKYADHDFTFTLIPVKCW
jgi:beta-galactosidase